MPDWDDDDLVAATAHDFLARYGPAVIEVLLSMESTARQLGDTLSADAWLDIAQSAAEQLRAARRGPLV
jgi:hypothetical protein